jgi:DNA invertase Pin-like site-specific DNA recombinase
VRKSSDFTRPSRANQPAFDRAVERVGRNVYREKVTGARGDRRELLRMLDRLDLRDVVTVTRIDRLARSSFDLFGIVKRIVDAKAQFRSPAEPWGDTGTSTGRLMLAVLGGPADVERNRIPTRTAEGRSRSRRKGGRWADGLPSAERGPPTPRGALRCKNWRPATPWAPFAA